MNLNHPIYLQINTRYNRSKINVNYIHNIIQFSSMDSEDRIRIWALYSSILDLRSSDEYEVTENIIFYEVIFIYICFNIKHKSTVSI